MFISVVIPARDAGATLGLLFESLAKSALKPGEIIVVDDGSEQPLNSTVAAHGVSCLRLSRSLGPAAARNLGAAKAKGDILVFLDADVTVHPDTLTRLVSALETDPTLDAVIGSYDNSPGHTGFWSRYRNLLHAWTHQTASSDASTFWGACGAVRRDAFLAVGGFPEVYDRPAIEDIELGCNLVKAGYRIRLDRQALVCHHKAWSFWKMMRTDIADRAIPWTRLILREGRIPDDLNLRRSQRFTAVLAVMMPALVPAVLAGRMFLVALGLVAGAYLLRNWSFYAFLTNSQGVWFTLRSMPAHWLYFVYSCLGFVLGVMGHLKDPAPARARIGDPARESRP